MVLGLRYFTEKYFLGVCPAEKVRKRNGAAPHCRWCLGVRATRLTGDGHREPATSPTKKNTHPTHLRASLPFSSSRSLDSDESADGQPSTQHEIHKAHHQTARVCIQALRVIYFTLSSPGFAPCGANVSTSPPSCTPR